MTRYLLDIHTPILRSAKEQLSDEFVSLFDSQAKQGNELVSSICSWERYCFRKKGGFGSAASMNKLWLQKIHAILDPYTPQSISSTARIFL